MTQPELSRRTSSNVEITGVTSNMENYAEAGVAALDAGMELGTLYDRLSSGMSLQEVAGFYGSLYRQLCILQERPDITPDQLQGARNVHDKVYQIFGRRIAAERGYDGMHTVGVIQKFIDEQMQYE